MLSKLCLYTNIRFIKTKFSHKRKYDLKDCWKSQKALLAKFFLSHSFINREYQHYEDLNFSYNAACPKKIAQWSFLLWRGLLTFFNFQIFTTLTYVIMYNFCPCFNLGLKFEGTSLENLVTDTFKNFFLSYRKMWILSALKSIVLRSQ